MHEEDELVPLSELEEHAKKWFDETFPDRESMFVDAFSNGRYHEQEAAWWEIAERLTNAELGNLTLAAIKALIRGTVDCRDGANLKTIMDFYEAFAKYLRHQLKSFDDLAAPLKKFRELLLEKARKEGGPWWVDCVRGFSLVELALGARMGLWSHPILEPYEKAMRDMVKRPDEAE